MSVTWPRTPDGPWEGLPLPDDQSAPHDVVTSGLEKRMVRIVNSSGMLVTLGLLAAVCTTACSASRVPNSAGPGAGHATTPAASSPAPAGSASPSAAAPSSAPSGSGGVQNLVVSTVVRSELTAAYAADRGIPVSDVAGADPMPGSVYYAYDPATDTYWAEAHFEPSSTAPSSVQVSFQDGTGIGMFKKVGTATWQVQINLNPILCAELRFFPLTVLQAWALPTAPQASSGLTC